MIFTTLNKIHAHNPCATRWQTLLTYLNKTTPDDEPLALSTILQSNGVADALWSLRIAPEHHKAYRLLAVNFAREVQHLMKDVRSVNALAVAERHANGSATDEELRAAADAAAAAADAAAAARWAAADARKAEENAR